MIELLLSDVRGIYIPRDFIGIFDMDKWHVSQEQALILSIPDDLDYWEVWNTVLDQAFYIDDKGRVDARPFLLPNKCYVITYQTAKATCRLGGEA